jgi:hypothetical protein
LQQEQQRRYLRLPHVDPGLRIETMRIAVVSICAYPPEHPLVLRNITPENRRSYRRLHGYDVHVHYDHPMPEKGVHIQHSKLQLVADYLRSGLYDWVAWFDCDSIITNLNRTLDSIIFKYARRDARFTSERKTTSNSSGYDTFGGHDAGTEPLEDEVLESFVGHVGSCNSDDGCFLSTTVRVNPQAHYVATLRVAQIDMAEDSERLSFVTIGGQDMGALAQPLTKVWWIWRLLVLGVPCKRWVWSKKASNGFETWWVLEGWFLACTLPGISLISFWLSILIHFDVFSVSSLHGGIPGECNPKPDSDYDCRLHHCFTVEVPEEAVATGRVTLEARASCLV